MGKDSPIGRAVKHGLTTGIFFASVMCMPLNLPRLGAVCKAVFVWLLALAALAGCRSAPTKSAGRVEWQRDDTSLALRSGTNVVWRFSFDPGKGKPFFHPLSVGGGPSLTNFKPEDHPWHYGLWFSWKYINRVNSTNHVNYWEEDRVTGNAQGKTRWTAPVINTTPQGGATIRLELSYINPSNQVDMTEKREITVSAPAADGGYTINWKAHFVAGDAAVTLDRTPMPGEPGGQTNGGYAGLSFRMAALPLSVSMLSTAGPVTNFVSDRARPAASAVACNFTEGAKVTGGVAILSDPANAGEKAPWYLIDDAKRTFRFACAAILAPKPLALAAGGKMDLNYCVCVQPQAWTVESLQAAQARWAGGNEPMR
jgi:hypothetical protein